MAGTTEQYYLKNIGIYDFDSTKWVWYVHAGDRAAKIIPNSGQQPNNIASTSPSVLNDEVITSFYIYDHLGNTRVTYTPRIQCPTFIEYTIDFAADYYPYGKVLRSFSDGETEKFLTTQHERDAETGLDYRGARFYDSDIARFLSLDPHAISYPSLSDYSYVAGNPIVFIDADGKDIINGDRIRYEEQKEFVAGMDVEKSRLNSIYGNIDNRREFNGTKAEWKSLESFKNQYSIHTQSLAELKQNADATDDLIEEFKLRSPNLFAKIDGATNPYGEKVDFILGVKDLFDKNFHIDNQQKTDLTGGYNEVPEFIIGENDEVRMKNRNGEFNAVYVYVERDKIDRDYFFFLFGQDVLRHETGHFIYMVENTAEYKKYLDGLKRDNRDPNGGHNHDDKSGKKAVEYGKQKDIKNE